jgi:hypothetical protein
MADSFASTSDGEVRLEVRHGSGRPLLYTVGRDGFLIGSVPGCDLRLPGTDLPPVVCLVTRGPDGRVGVRKLTSVLPLQVNGQPVWTAALANGDRLQLGPVELVARLPPAPSGGRSADPGIEEADAARKKLTALRQQLYDRYRQRRDRLAGLHEAINRAAANLQERKRLHDADAQDAAARREVLDAREADLDRRERVLGTHLTELEDNRSQLAEDRRGLDEQQAAFGQKQHELDQARCTLEAQHTRYQADLVRLDRQAATLEERTQRLDERARETDQRRQRLEEESQELEDQARALETLRSRLEAEADELRRQRDEVQAERSEVSGRAAALETQQAALVQLRTRLERVDEGLRRDEQALTSQRYRQEQTRHELQEQAVEFERRRREAEQARLAREAEARSLEEARVTFEADVARLRAGQEELAAAQERLRQVTAAVEAEKAAQADQGGELAARADRIAGREERLAQDRQRLREREAALAEAESARESLQEQLRRRAEELSERQQELGERDRQHTDWERDARQAREQVERERRRLEEVHAARHDEFARRAEMVREQEAALRQADEDLGRRRERLRATGRAAAIARKHFADRRRAWDSHQRQREAALARDRAEGEVVRAEAAELRRQLPQWEDQARAANEHLARTRDQLSGHLAELHAYARQAQEDLEALRAHVKAEAEEIAVQRTSLHRARDDHRVAVTAFRQQLIEWQGRVAEMKRDLSRNETCLEQRRAEVDEATDRLARQSERLREQETAVNERREEMDRHLAEMRQWYRRKLRELTERSFADTAEAAPAAADGSPVEAADAGPVILGMEPEPEPGDRRLGELLRSHRLVDADTLTALLAEARRQRRPLRQMLLAGGSVTLFQLALIEAGNIDGLMLGPMRVLDRLRTTTRETVYRVHDPRPGSDGSDALLRHLAAAEMDDAVRPDDFRRRFAAAAAVRHPHVAGVREVLEIHGRPAVLLEWVRGLSASDWPALSSVPGVWVRLLAQAAAGLCAAHQTGVVHGHLHPSLVLLTSEGVLKICGLGEPFWLAAPETLPAPDATEPDPVADLAALGHLASAWAAAPAPKRKRGKGKALPACLEAILLRLSAGDGAARYPDASAAVEDLERARAEAPCPAESWDRLIEFVRAHELTDHPWRRSA